MVTVAKAVYSYVLPCTLWHTGITVNPCHCGIFNVALYSKYLKQCFAIHIVAYWCYCQFLSLCYYAMLHCTLSI